MAVGGIPAGSIVLSLNFFVCIHFQMLSETGHWARYTYGFNQHVCSCSQIPVLMNKPVRYLVACLSA